jgi:hypothetical protein
MQVKNTDSPEQSEQLTELNIDGAAKLLGNIMK